MNLLTRTLVAAVIREEATKARCGFEEVLNIGQRAGAIAARRAAIRRISAMTGCSSYELADTWGCEPHTVRAALSNRTALAGTYDAATVERLRWKHGEARAAEIVAGRDPMTRNDRAAWARLCAKGAAADTSGRIDLAREEP